MGDGSGSVLHGFDREYVGNLLKAGVLSPIEEPLLNEQGYVVVTCCDGRQMRDKITHLDKILTETALLHLLSDHGGPLRLVKNSPTNGETPFFDEYWLASIRRAHRMMRLNTVMLMGHGPCGMARECNIPVREYFDHLMAAKERIKAECPGMNVMVTYHACQGLDRKKTYHVGRKKYMAFKDNPPD